MIGLRRVLSAIGSGLADLVVAAGDPAVRDVVVAEPAEPEGAPGDEIHPGDLVLGVGARDEPAALAMIGRCAAAGAAALLLRPPVADLPAVTEAAGSAGVALVSVHGRVSWAQLVWLLRGVVDTGSVATGAGAGVEAPAYHDLFALADVAAAVLDAPVTIEDEHSRVLAYSHRQEHADAARLSTIVGRRVPGEVLRAFRSRGVFRKLGRGSEPIFVPGQPDGTLPRLIVPVRVAGRLLGSMWAIVPDEPPAERVHAFADTAAVVALHLLRLRAAADVARRIAADRLRAAITGGATGGERVPTDRRELELPPGPYRVVALSGSDDEDSDAERALARWESLARSRGWRRPAMTVVDGAPYAVTTAAGAESEAGSWAWLGRLAAEQARTDASARAAAGGVAPGITELPRSGAEAGTLLRLLRDGLVAGPVARQEDAWAAAVLDRVTGAVPPDELLGFGPLRRVLDDDATRGSWYAETLRAHLEHPGDPAAASRALHVHPNTFRYRLRRLRSALPVDLESPAVRLALQIQLTALRWRGSVVRGGQDPGHSSSGRDDDRR